MATVKQSVITLGAHEGQSVSVAGGNYRMLISGKQTGGEFATIEMSVPPGGGPGPHAHPDFQESFYVIEGEVEVQSEEGIYTAVEGAYIVIPKGGMVHGFKNKSNALAKLLCVVVPSGLEEMFLELGVPVANGEFLPPPVMDEAMKKKVLALFEKYGQQMYPPDYFTTSVKKEE
ncbi:cupin domain-containing protein [Chitinophaga sp.]|uniref:cupin domain-containing protein n=1 Tax=Chitinophaga sp. TaxID=1869181 RepID=UPI002F948D46